MRKFIAVILGSKSDLKMVWRSNMISIFDEVGVAYELSVISAHRNPHDLSNYCPQAVADGAQVFIGVAGMAAALPGAIASNLLFQGSSCPVIGVPLPSEHFQNALDALLAMVQIPSGVPVAVCGIGKAGLENAALLACKILSLGDAEIRTGLDNYMKSHAKEPEYNVGLIYGGES